MLEDNKLTYIKEIIDKLNNEINILRDNFLSFKRKKLICKTIVKLLLFITTTIGIVVIGSICSINLFIMLFSSMSLIIFNILINDFINKVLNKKYNIHEIKELIRDKKVLLNEYNDKEKALINTFKNSCYKDKKIMLVTEDMNKQCSSKELNNNIKIKKKIKKC